MAEPQVGPRVLHIRFEGRSVDVPLKDLDIGELSTDIQVKQALAVYLDVPVAKFNDYVVDRHETGNLTVRPEAIFGCSCKETRNTRTP